MLAAAVLALGLTACAGAGASGQSAAGASSSGAAPDSIARSVPEPAQEQTVEGSVAAASMNSLHGTISVDAPVAAVVPQGTALHRAAFAKDGWFVIQYGGETVYCASGYLRR